jgi:hypothetical protein
VDRDREESSAVDHTIAAFCFFCWPVGLVLSIVYLTSIRHQLETATT